jgi:hypothetical protein
MFRISKVFLPLAATLVAAGSVAGIAYATGSAGGAQASYTVVMSGLDNPRGLTFARSGKSEGEGEGGWSLYVAEAGTGGSLRCTPLRGPVCVGLTGAVSRLRNGHQTRVVSGLPSYAPFNAANAGAVGPSDVSFADGRGYVSIGLAAPVSIRAALGEKFGWIASFDKKGSVSYETDVSAYELQANPDLGPYESNPYGLLAGAGKWVVADAASNSLLQLSPSGSISTLAVFPSRFYPSAGSRTTDAVPNSVATGPDGAYYVGELTGSPFNPGTANVWRVVQGQAPEVYCSGFSFIIDIAFDRHGDLYVLENASGLGGPIAGTPGQLLRVGSDCSKTPVATGLPAPTSVAIGPDGNAYLSIFGTSAAVGQVVRVDLAAQHREDDNDGTESGD